jgi:hypothetical protein
MPNGAALAADDPFARTHPVLSFPRRGVPTHVPAGSQPVTSETSLAIGDRVWAHWGASWFPGEVMELQDADLVKVHYFLRSQSGELVPRAKLRLPNPADPTSTVSEAIESDPNSPNPFRRR